MQSAKSSSFAPFGSLGVQGGGTQVGSMNQQTGGQNTGLPGDATASVNQTQAPTEPIER